MAKRYIVSDDQQNVIDTRTGLPVALPETIELGEYCGRQEAVREWAAELNG